MYPGQTHSTDSRDSLAPGVPQTPPNSRGFPGGISSEEFHGFSELSQLDNGSPRRSRLFLSRLHWPNQTAAEADAPSLPWPPRRLRHPDQDWSALEPADATHTIAPSELK